VPLTAPPRALALALAGCAAPPDAALLAEALGAADPQAALAACGRIGGATTADECRASVVQAHAALIGPEADQACGSVRDSRWRGECFFTLAERRMAGAAATPEGRLPALQACGEAGPFYDECLYHLWTGELSAVARAAPTAPAAVEPARPIVAYWSNLETIAGDPADQLWGDLWFFAWNEHRPADLQACGALAPPDAAACRTHTQAFVLRAILGELLAPGAPPGVLDRTCRSGSVEDDRVAGLFVPHPDLDAQVAEAARLACDAADGKAVRRYNPVFQPRGGGGAP